MMKNMKKKTRILNNKQIKLKELKCIKVHIEKSYAITEHMLNSLAEIKSADLFICGETSTAFVNLLHHPKILPLIGNFDFDSP